VLMTAHSIRMPLGNILFSMPVISLVAAFLRAEGNVCDLVKEVKLDYFTNTAGFANLLSVILARSTLGTVMRVYISKSKRRTDRNDVTLCVRSNDVNLYLYPWIASGATSEVLELRQHSIEYLNGTPGLRSLLFGEVRTKCLLTGRSRRDELPALSVPWHGFPPLRWFG
jgi:hypothetical protein